MIRVPVSVLNTVLKKNHYFLTHLRTFKFIYIYIYIYINI